MSPTRSLVMAFIALVVIATLGMAGGAAMGGPGMFGPGMMGGYYGATPVAPGNWGLLMGLGMVAMVAFWTAIVVGIVLLVRALVGVPITQTSARDVEEPLTVLRRRYAAGEIDEATYERMKRELAA